jgi:putative ABC transport system permease protein
MLTALGMVIGNASVILVVTISLTSREYILEQISGVGSNLIYAYFQTGSREATSVAADYIKMADVEAVRRQLGPQIKAATGVMLAGDTISIDGRRRDIALLGTDEYYSVVRNLIPVAGRMLDSTDVMLRQRVILLTQQLAVDLYGSPANAIAKILKIHGMQFTVIGVFREKTESFGLTEVTKSTVLMPHTVLRYFAPMERVDPLYVQAWRAEEVEALTAQVRQILESRHRPGASYFVSNLGPILDAARSVSLVLTGVLIIIAAIALVISGVGIMNIMLVTVTERTREIGVRLAIGASRTAILQQFLAEAILISLGGGLIGVLIGVSIPLSVTLFVDQLSLPISWAAVTIAFVVSFGVGLIFGLLPASRAARLNPTEALRYE